MPAIKSPTPEIFHITNDAFRRGTTPVKGRLFGLPNRELMPSSTGSGNPNWIIERIMPIIISQTQRGSRFRHPLGIPEVYPPVYFLVGTRLF